MPLDQLESRDDRIVLPAATVWKLEKLPGVRRRGLPLDHARRLMARTGWRKRVGVEPTGDV